MIIAYIESMFQRRERARTGHAPPSGSARSVVHSVQEPELLFLYRDIKVLTTNFSGPIATEHAVGHARA